MSVTSQTPPEANGPSATPSIASLWWETLLHPERAGRLIVGGVWPAGFTRFLVITLTGMTAAYGLTMGLYMGPYPALVSAIKLPFLYLFTTLLALPALYVINCLWGPSLSSVHCSRMLLLAINANAAALASYAPVSAFFSLTTGEKGYGTLILMHVLVFTIAGLVSLVVIGLIFRTTAAEVGRTFNAPVFAGWSALYALVGMQMAWTLRPWIGAWYHDYQIIRPIQWSFYERIISILQGAGY